MTLAASDCGNPGIPDGGAKQGMRYNMGNVVKYRCEDGFTMFGKATRECLRNRRWSGEEVTCEGQQYWWIPWRIPGGGGQGGLTTPSESFACPFENSYGPAF